MYIIIIGCGKVGLSLAEQLSDENHDITLVDSSADKLQNLSDDLDAMIERLKNRELLPAEVLIDLCEKVGISLCLS